jgi:tetratricopeptide (TPR) repeat protein
MWAASPGPRSCGALESAEGPDQRLEPIAREWAPDRGRGVVAPQAGVGHRGKSPGVGLFDGSIMSVPTRSGNQYLHRANSGEAAFHERLVAFPCLHPGPHSGLHIRSFEIEAARESLEDALCLYREIGDRRVEGNARGNLGLAFRDLGQVDRAIEYLEQALVIAREIGDRRVEGNALGNLGLAVADLGQFERAFGYCERQLVIVRKIGDRRVEGNALNNLGLAYRHLGQVERAIDHYEQALVIAREIGDPRSEGYALNDLGLACRHLGQVERAIDYYEQAPVIFREIGERRGEGENSGQPGPRLRRPGPGGTGHWPIRAIATDRSGDQKPADHPDHFRQPGATTPGQVGRESRRLSRMIQDI